VSANFDPKKDAANIKKHRVSLSQGDGVRESSQCGSPIPKSGETMKKVYDFSKGKRGAVVPATGKTRITIYVDDAVIQRFKTQSEKTGKGYQTLINDALKSSLGLTEQPVTQELVRKIVREELAASS
jgi:uncharacterized protein (DUF4415 family)